MDRARKDFFVSYTSVDTAWAEWVAHVLEDAGYTVVIQAWDFMPGSNFVIEMQQALQSADRLIAVLSPDYLAARYPQPEWAAVFATDPQGADRRLVPVMVRRCEPDGLLSQVVQIRIYDVDATTAQRKLLEGVRAGRAKPLHPPAFPGMAVTLPRSAGSTVTMAGERLSWRRLPSPPAVIWRAALEDRMPHQSGYAAVELHLVPVGDDGRLQVRDLTDLKSTLPRYGREHDIFSPTEAVDARSDATKVVTGSTARDRVAGLAVTRHGQRSVWSGLPRDMLGAVLDESHLTDQLVALIDALIGLPIADVELVVPYVGIEPAAMVSVGRVADMPRSSAQLGHTMSEYLRPSSEDAVALIDLRRHGAEVAIELSARLMAERRAPARSPW